MEGSTPPGARAMRDFAVDADSGPSSLVLKGCAPLVGLATPPRRKEVAAPAAASPKGCSSGAVAAAAASSSVEPPGAAPTEAGAASAESPDPISAWSPITPDGEREKAARPRLRTCKYGRRAHCDKPLRPTVTREGEPLLRCPNSPRAGPARAPSPTLVEQEAMGFPARVAKRVLVGFA
eukprot:6351455-Alexandrium_andersonii.AAC.1